MSAGKISSNTLIHTNSVDQPDYSSNTTKVILIAAGAFLLLAGVALLLASLFLVPQGMTGIGAWKIGSLVGALVGMAGGVGLLLGNILKNRCTSNSQVAPAPKATDSAKDYDFEFLKKIADGIIISAYERGLVSESIYKIQTKFMKGDTVAHTCYPSSDEEIKEYHAKVPAIVEHVREYVEKKLQIAVPISKLDAIMKEHNRKLFPYIF